MAGINLKQDSNEFKIRMVQDTGPGRQGRQKDSACTDHFTRYARHEVDVQDDLDVEHDLIGRRKRGIGSN